MAMETSKEKAAPVFLTRSSRSTRGKRTTKLLDKEVEEDELFWNQEALREEENDAEYEVEPDVADEVDSDFNEDDSGPEEKAENEVDDRTQSKKRLLLGKISSKKQNKKRVVSKIEKPSKDEASTDHSTPPEHHDSPDDTEMERTPRKSTRTSIIDRQAEKDES